MVGERSHIKSVKTNKLNDNVKFTIRIPKTMNDLVLFFRIKDEISHRKVYLIR